MMQHALAASHSLLQNGRLWKRKNQRIRNGIAFSPPFHPPPVDRGRGRERESQGRIDFHFPKLHLTSPSVRASAVRFDCMQFSRCRRRSLQQASPPARYQRCEERRSLALLAGRSGIGNFYGTYNCCCIVQEPGSLHQPPLMPSWRRLAG